MNTTVAGRRRAGNLLIALLGALWIPAALAHRVDELLQATLLALAPGAVTVEITITPGVEVADSVLARVDQDRDGVISPAESEAYARLVLKSLELALDGHPVALELLGQEMAPPSEVRSGLGLIRIKARAGLGRVADGEHEILFRNRHASPGSAFLANALTPESPSIRILRQRRDELQTDLRVDYRLQATPAENWPCFRGPTRQGMSTETGLPVKWNETENVLWKVAIPGESWSSPIVWGERVFLTTATDNGTSCRVLALNAQSGEVLWNREVFQQVPRRKEGRNSYATPTPATDGDRVYACFGDGSFAALNFAGDLVWTNRDYKFYGQHGLGSSPILFHDLLIMARDGSSDGGNKKLGWQEPWDQSYLLALDTTTGRERWRGRRGLSRISHGVPNIWKHAGRAEIVSEAGDVVQGFDAQTGERLWSSEVIGEGKVPSVVIGDGLVFTSGGWGGKETIKAFRLGGRGDLKESNLVWEQKKGMPKVPSMLFLSPHLFAVTDGGVASCLKAGTGELLWQERIGGNFSASPVGADGRIYLLSDEGEATVIEAGPEFKVLSRNPLSGKVQASMAVSGRRIFIRTAAHLYCIGHAPGGG